MGFNKFGGDRGGDRGGRSFGGGGFGGGRPGGDRKFGGRSDGPKQMFPAVCSTCGQDCEIPFRPTGIHPVFCRNCFKNQPQTGAAGAPRFSPASKFSAPKFASKNFMGNGMGQNAPVAPNSGITKAQFDALNSKVERILDILISGKPERSEDRGLAIGARPVKEMPEEKETFKKSKAPAKKAKGKKK